MAGGVERGRGVWEGRERVRGGRGDWEGREA